MKGLTNVIKFDHQGFRTDFLLDIVELGPQGLRKIGTWNSTQGVNFTRTYGEVQKEIGEILQNKTLIVTAILVSLIHFIIYNNPDRRYNSYFHITSVESVHIIHKCEVCRKCLII